MERMQDLFSGSGAFAISFLVSLALLGLVVSLYSLVSAHREMTLIRKGNTAACASDAECASDRCTDAGVCADPLICF